MNYTTLKWLGTHTVDGPLAAKLLNSKTMSNAWLDLNPSERAEVLWANSRRGVWSDDLWTNPFNGKKDDSRIIPCSFKLSDGKEVTGRYVRNGKTILVLSCGRKYGIR